MKLVEQSELDWLAEGEMDSCEQSELFLRLDVNDQWKQCALALLEREALRHALTRSDEASSASIVVRDDQKGESVIKQGKQIDRQARQRTWVLVALAAMVSFLMFAIGYFIAPNNVYQNLSDNSVDDPASALADAERLVEQSQEAVVSWLAEGDSEALAAFNVAVSAAGIQDGQLIAMVSSQRNAERIFVPLIQSETLQKRISSLPPPAMPQDLSISLQKSGYRMFPQRQLIALSHEDGTNEVLPMNVLDCKFVGKSIF